MKAPRSASLSSEQRWKHCSNKCPLTFSKKLVCKVQVCCCNQKTTRATRKQRQEGLVKVGKSRVGSSGFVLLIALTPWTQNRCRKWPQSCIWAFRSHRGLRKLTAAWSCHFVIPFLCLTKHNTAYSCCVFNCWEIELEGKDGKLSSEISWWVLKSRVVVVNIEQRHGWK